VTTPEATLDLLLISVRNNGIPHSDHNPACHEADAKLIEGIRLPANAVSVDAEPKDWEEHRKANGWPTPNHMRRTADALDVLTPAKYGDILRWVADACDIALVPSDPHE